MLKGVETNGRWRIFSPDMEELSLYYHLFTRSWLNNGDVRIGENGEFEAMLDVDPVKSFPNPSWKGYRVESADAERALDNLEKLLFYEPEQMKPLVDSLLLSCTAVRGGSIRGRGILCHDGSKKGGAC